MGRATRVLRFRDGEMRLDHPVLMGIVNVTPDSFSDGGRFLEPARAVEHALRLADEGAEILDVGGESTRPGAEPVSEGEEWRRVQPVLKSLRRKTDARISIDSSKWDIAAKALSVGTDMVNDARGFRDEPMVTLVAKEHVPVAVMHMKGAPKTMQRDATYGDVVAEVIAFLETQAQHLVAAGVDPESILIDPGLGFGKRPEHNTEILQRLPEFHRLGYPILIGASGKSFLPSIGGRDVVGRSEAGLAIANLAVRNGANVLRVHDVGATSKALRAVDAIVGGTR